MIFQYLRVRLEAWEETTYPFYECTISRPVYYCHRRAPVDVRIRLCAFDQLR
jgi:hypothetical protein